ncbi:hypothetical protein [Flavisolibacter nicotianae]|uniref:hypothetical protein n=1 Tax=Flavisolibacter nicotianae TaxID=2364882 RepID=UPI000EADF90D|nr:hypothetical protein [Flavisolibacter nicotianae]
MKIKPKILSFQSKSSVSLFTFDITHKKSPGTPGPFFTGEKALIFLLDGTPGFFSKDWIKAVWILNTFRFSLDPGLMVKMPKSPPIAKQQHLFSAQIQNLFSRR